MAEGDTILRTARRLEAALAGTPVAASAPHPRGRAAGVERLDGLTLTGVRTLGKHLLLDFGELILHSHLGMSGSWRLYRRGGAPERILANAWAVLAGRGHAAVQRGGPTLRLLRSEQVRRDPALARLGPDILAAEPGLDAALASLRAASPGLRLGEALLDQRLVCGIGNIFRSEGCFAASVSPWRALGDLDEEEMRRVLTSTRALMEESVAGGQRPRAVYRRAGRPCPSCGVPVLSAGQGDANRAAYWCGHCQA